MPAPPAKTMPFMTDSSFYQAKSLLLVALLQEAPPGFIGEIPRNGLTQTGLKIVLSSPPQLTLDARGVDRITLIVARSIRHMFNQLGMRHMRGFGKRSSRLSQIAWTTSRLVRSESSHKVNPPRLPLGNRQNKRPGMVLNMKPVADLKAGSIHRQRLSRECLENHQGNQFFRKLKRTVVVGAVRDERRKAIGFVPGLDEMVRTGLARRVRRAGLDWRGLRKAACLAERAVDFIGGDMKKAEAVCLSVESDFQWDKAACSIT